jgi:leucyl aminopeptidase
MARSKVRVSTDSTADDPRCVFEAAKAGIARAVQAGATKPLLFLDDTVATAGADYSEAPLVTLLGALDACYATIQTREFKGEAVAEPVTALGLYVRETAVEEVDAAIAKAVALEKGRRVARDICAGDPERMAPPRVAEYVAAEFAGVPNVKCSVEEGLACIEEKYPLLAAVCRASRPVERHHPRIIRCEYTPADGEVDRLLILVGKGVTYDTGGADIKAGGIMAGMKRDKGGAAAVAGFMRVVGEVQPKGLKVIALLGMVRNDVGPDSYVGDEVIVGHAGKRVLVVNTDAEGRMVMADLLSVARELAVDAVKGGIPSTHVQLHTCATLTGHAVVAVGSYPIAVDNGPAAALHVSGRLQAAAHVAADPFEISTLRKEDYTFVAPKHSSYDVLQCNTLPSSRTPRGHQFPMAFLVMASGLGDHGRDSEVPIPYTHLDIAAAANRGDVASGFETGSPVVGLANYHLFSAHA